MNEASVTCIVKLMLLNRWQICHFQFSLWNRFETPILWRPSANYVLLKDTKVQASDLIAHSVPISSNPSELPNILLQMISVLHSSIPSGMLNRISYTCPGRSSLWSRSNIPIETLSHWRHLLMPSLILLTYSHALPAIQARRNIPGGPHSP